MTKEKEPIPTTPLKWGQVALMLLAAAVCAVYTPIWLLYAGALRFLWCFVGGQAGRGLLSLIAFGVVYLTLTLARELEPRESAVRPAELDELEPAERTTWAEPHPGFSSTVYARGRGWRP